MSGSFHLLSLRFFWGWFLFIFQSAAHAQDYAEGDAGEHQTGSAHAYQRQREAGYREQPNGYAHIDECLNDHADAQPKCKEGSISARRFYHNQEAAV
jgi:hypothetical protein